MIPLQGPEGLWFYCFILCIIIFGIPHRSYDKLRNLKASPNSLGLPQPSIFVRFWKLFILSILSLQIENRRARIRYGYACSHEERKHTPKCYIYIHSMVFNKRNIRYYLLATSIQQVSLFIREKRFKATIRKSCHFGTMRFDSGDD